jgi:hypothetical protein
MHGSALVVLHLFLLGWALARAGTVRQRVLASAVVVAMVGTFSWNHARDGLTILVVLVMLWFPVTRVPSFLVPVVRVLAAASLYIYVIHWQALEVLWGHPVAAFVGSMALGVGYWWLWSRPLTAAWRAVSRWVGVSRPAPTRPAQRPPVRSYRCPPWAGGPARTTPSG